MILGKLDNHLETKQNFNPASHIHKNQFQIDGWSKYDRQYNKVSEEE